MSTVSEEAKQASETSKSTPKKARVTSLEMRSSLWRWAWFFGSCLCHPD